MCTAEEEQRRRDDEQMIADALRDMNERIARNGW